jgi:hypothetical protein
MLTLRLICFDLFSVVRVISFFFFIFRVSPPVSEADREKTNSKAVERACFAEIRSDVTLSAGDENEAENDQVGSEPVSRVLLSCNQPTILTGTFLV